MSTAKESHRPVVEHKKYVKDEKYIRDHGVEHTIYVTVVDGIVKNMSLNQSQDLILEA
jgi:hypothetical protein